MPRKEGVLDVSGSVIDRATHRGVEGLRIEAWDKDLMFNDLVGSAVTNEQGDFQMEFDGSNFQELFLDGSPDLFFKVFRENQLIRSTEGSTVWSPRVESSDIIIEIDVTKGEQPEPWLQVNSLNELEQHEPEILQRIANIPNGGYLFMIHPFMLLEDIGVQLSDQTRQEILNRVPELTALSAIPYRALRATTEPQRLHIHLQGLFPGRTR